MAEDETVRGWLRVYVVKSVKFLQTLLLDQATYVMFLECVAVMMIFYLIIKKCANKESKFVKKIKNFLFWSAFFRG